MLNICKQIRKIHNHLNIKNIDNVAFIIPSYPPHYKYVYNLLESLNKFNIHITVHIVFSSNEDYNTFTMKSKIIALIIDVPIVTKCIVTYKKFYGLKQLINSKYDYFIVCDSEIDIVSENINKDNLTNYIVNYFNNKRIYAGNISNSTNPYKFIPIECGNESIKLFNEKYHDEIISKTCTFNLYTWFSDLPVYKRSTLDTFFNMIDITKIDSIFAFDYIIYQYFLVIKVEN